MSTYGQVIYKYYVPTTDRAQLTLPKSAKIVHIGAQGNNICVWAAINQEAKRETEIRTLYVRATGEYIESYLEYLGTAQLVNDEVYHVFQKEERNNFEQYALLERELPEEFNFYPTLVEKTEKI